MSSTSDHNVLTGITAAEYIDGRYFVPADDGDVPQG
jgi:hypothetical protein